MNTTRAVLTFENANGKQEIRFFRTIAEAQNAIASLRSFGQGRYYNFKIKIIKPY